MYKSLSLFALIAYSEAIEWGRGNFNQLFGRRSVYAPYESYGFRNSDFGYGDYDYDYDSDGPRRSAHDKDYDTYGHENGPHGFTELGEKNYHGGDDPDYSRGSRYGYGGWRKSRHQELDLDDYRRGGYG